MKIKRVPPRRISEAVSSLIEKKKQKKMWSWKVCILISIGVSCSSLHLSQSETTKALISLIRAASDESLLSTLRNIQEVPKTKVKAPTLPNSIAFHIFIPVHVVNQFLDMTIFLTIYHLLFSLSCALSLTYCEYSSLVTSINTS